MSIEDKIDIDLFKVVNRAIAESDDLEIMAIHLTQLLVVALQTKGCTIFVLNPETRELELIASSGLSIDYINKGPLFSNKSIRATLKGEPVVVRDIHTSNQLQYPEDAEKEGIGAIVSLPIKFGSTLVGALRLYHHEPWDVSERDLDSLHLLGENIGLAMTYTRLVTAIRDIRNTVDEVDLVWLDKKT
jgi:transcriptional regulator with GAF, ATPase, and Fis domain